MFGSVAAVLERPVGVGPVALSGSSGSSGSAGSSGLGRVVVFPGGVGVAGGVAGGVPVVELSLLGGFALAVDGAVVSVGSSGERLLAVLACRGRAASRGQLAAALWPEATSERGLANLRTALYRLVRRAPGAVHISGNRVQLNLGVQVDLEASTRLAQRILAAGVLDEELAAQVAHADFTGDLLPDWDAEWLGDYQYRYRQLRLTALETLSARLADAGHHGAAVQAALAAVHADGLRDSAHETLIKACLAQGNRNEATTHYFTYRRILRDELGLDPPTTLSHLLTSA
jgi:DNA-binding SARP family transcriptional activator